MKWWKCTCGRVYPENYFICKCGKKKSEVVSEASVSEMVPLSEMNETAEKKICGCVPTLKIKCWRCGNDISEGSAACVFCSASLNRTVPQTEEGKALRTVYDSFGCKAVFNNRDYLVNSLGDLLSESKMLRNHISVAMDAGVGELYLKQLQKGGPNADFIINVRKQLVDGAGLSDSTATRLIELFDEMIGWRTLRAEEVNIRPEKYISIDTVINDRESIRTDEVMNRSNAQNACEHKPLNNNEYSSGEITGDRNRKSWSTGVVLLMIILVAATISLVVWGVKVNRENGSDGTTEDANRNVGNSESSVASIVSSDTELSFAEMEIRLPYGFQVDYYSHNSYIDGLRSARISITNDKSIEYYMEVERYTKGEDIFDYNSFDEFLESPYGFYDAISSTVMEQGVKYYSPKLNELVTAFESDEAFWTVSFYSYSDNYTYESMKGDFLSIVKEVHFSPYTGLKSKGIEMMLPQSFQVEAIDTSANPDIYTSFYSENSDISIYVIMQTRKELIDEGIWCYNEDEYLKLCKDQYLKDLEVTENCTTLDNGSITYYTYKIDDGIGYLVTAYVSERAYWLVFFACDADIFETNKDDFLKWARTVGFYMDKGDTAGKWEKKGEEWYFENYVGRRKADEWIKQYGKWYYLNGDGIMQTGWEKIAGKWYFFDSKGVMQTGWKKIEGKWYYFNSNGVMQTGTVTIDGKSYSFDSNGVWIDDNAVDD